MRLGRFGLSLHPDKTRLLPFRRPPAGQRRGKGPATFDFLGSARLRRAIQSVNDWCRRHRHLSVKDQHTALTRRLRGHFNYFGVNGNLRGLQLLVEATKPIWYKWLCRRSQRSRLTWERFHALLEQFPLPKPRITVQIWGRQP